MTVLFALEAIKNHIRIERSVSGFRPELHNGGFAGKHRKRIRADARALVCRLHNLQTLLPAEKTGVGDNPHSVIRGKIRLESAAAFFKVAAGKEIAAEVGDLFQFDVAKLNFARSARIEVDEEVEILQIACLEEIAWENGWLTSDEVLASAGDLMKTDYGRYLARIIRN